MTPDNSILYCSQKCSRKDAKKPLSASILPASTSDSTPTSSKATSPIQSPRSLYQSTPIVRIPEELHDHKSDLDPTEWKPKLPRGASDAYRYLSQFHANINRDDSEYVRAERPRHKHTMSMTTTPSLGSTPTTVSSSFDSLYSYNRPLNQRTNPMYALSNGAKSTELVTPHIPPIIQIDEATPAIGMTWEKKVVIRGGGDGGDGIGALLNSAK